MTRVYDDDTLREEPEVVVRDAAYSFLPPVRVEVNYTAQNGTSGDVLHLTWLAAQDLYQQLGEKLRFHTEEEE